LGRPASTKLLGASVRPWGCQCGMMLALASPVYRLNSVDKVGFIFGAEGGG